MTRKQKKESTCSNCGYKFKDADNYCPKCGQKNHEIKIPLKHLIEEFLESSLHLDTKIFNTIKLLLFSPGQLSKDYNDGKRVKYISPVRLYVIISFLFFLIINLYTPKDTFQTSNSIENKKKIPWD
jgi:hypothetical protein